MTAAARTIIAIMIIIKIIIAINSIDENNRFSASDTASKALNLTYWRHV